MDKFFKDEIDFNAQDTGWKDRAHDPGSLDGLKPKPTKTIAIDFDGTLFTSNWPDIGEPIWPTIQAAIRAQEQGAELVLWTSRQGAKLREAVAACAEVGLYFSCINCNTHRMQAIWGNDPRKIGADEYWDDRAVRPEDLWSRNL